MANRVLIGDDKRDLREPGDPLPGEDVRRTRMPPVPMPKTGIAPGNAYGGQRANGVVHWGIDLAARPSELVVAPEDGVIVDVWTDNETPPFVGYGPGGVLLKGESGVFHLLGHLDPGRWTASSRPTIGEVFEVGQQIGNTAPTGSPGVFQAAPHVHWEVRTKPHDSPATRQANTTDPVKWRAGMGRATSRVLSEASGSRSSGLVWLLLLFAVSRRR
jgi:murein DD-endopeptidase MepM/ murein hydrolase activator NlpD